MATEKAREAEPETAEVVQAEPDLYFEHEFGKPWEGPVLKQWMHYHLVGGCKICGKPVYANLSKPFDATERLKGYGAGLALYDPKDGKWWCHEHAPKDEHLFETLGNCRNCGRMGFIARTDVQHTPLPASEYARLVGDQFATVVRTSKNQPPELECGRCRPYATAEAGDGDKRLEEMRALAAQIGLPVIFEAETGRDEHRGILTP